METKGFEIKPCIANSHFSYHISLHDIAMELVRGQKKSPIKGTAHLTRSHTCELSFSLYAGMWAYVRMIVPNYAYADSDSNDYRCNLLLLHLFTDASSVTNKRPRDDWQLVNVGDISAVYTQLGDTIIRLFSQWLFAYHNILENFFY